MSTKHTPGPWGPLTLLPDNLEIGIDYPDGDDRDHYLATVTCGDPDELQANAQLIAAAPELLAALAWIDRLVSRDEGCDGDDLEAISVKARAAIAKAIGEPQ
jgi:hypothetical protein